MITMNKQQSGFILPTVIAISLATLAVLVSLLMLTTSTYKGGSYDYYQKIADEAAEAGTAYATACLSLSTHVQTWGPAVSKNNLTPNSGCDGVNTYPANAYIYSDSKVRTYFSVGNMDYSYQFSAQVSALGYADVLRADGSVIKTYSSVRKKVITWPTDIGGQMSDSGTNRTCAIVNYSVYCWGYNAYGQLGDGRYLGTGDIETASSVDSRVPVKVRRDAGVMAGKKIVKIFVAQYHSCALSDDGLMYCWGYNSAGQIGNGTATNAPVPVQVGGALAGKTITEIGGTNNLSCAIAEGKIYCWGSNNSGITGRNTVTGYTNTPTLVTAGNTATTLPTNYTATLLATSGSRARLMCAVVSGKPYCWGQNDEGSVGNGTSGGNVLIPTKVVENTGLSGKTITSISQDGNVGGAGSDFSHVCVVASGKLYCWGDNTYGQVGNGENANSKNSPTAVTSNGVLNGKTIQDVKVGIYTSCSLADGGVYCWGRSNYGQVGDGTTTSRLNPVAAAQQPGNLTSSNVVSIGSGANRGCATVADGRTFCWGLNSSGQIGDGTITTRTVPTESLFLRPVGNQYIF